MSHRILLVGEDRRGLAPLEASLRRLGQAVVVAADAQQAAALARQFHPSVLVLVSRLALPPGKDWFAALAMHPATSSLPTVLVSPVLTVDAAIAAFQSGVSDVLAEPLKGEELVTRLETTLGNGADANRRMAAIDRRGSAMTRRICAYLVTAQLSGELHVDAGGDSALVTFQRGVVQEARFRNLQGDAALQALVEVPSEAVWGFSFVDQSIIPAAAPVGAFEFVLDVSPTGEVFELVDVAQGDGDAGLSPPRLLLVDDDSSLVAIYSKFLERAGLQVHTAKNGQQGYTEAVRLLPDIILSDIMMPETDGWGFLTLVRDNFRLRETPFMLLSCQVNFVEKLRDLEAGADDYLEKGVRGEVVVKRVNDLLEPRRRMIAQLDPSSAFQGNTGLLGLQTLLAALGDKGASGTLHVNDGLVRYALGMFEGRLVMTTATSNGRVSHGREALLSVLGIDDAPFAFMPMEVPPVGPGPRFADMRDAVCAELNQARDHLRERMLSGDSTLHFHPTMSTFYRMVSPEVVQAIMDALASGSAPREVMASGITSPVLVDWVVKDMLRKGVARFA